MKIIIFDLFGTLIDKEQYYYDEALQWLAETHFDNRISELRELSQLFKNKYIQDRKLSNKENSFFNQLNFFENELSIKISENLASVELNFIRIFRKEKLNDGAVQLLDYLTKNNYKVFILSNSIFSGKNLKEYLNQLNIGKYIEKVFSSADIGYRKPSKEIFKYIIVALKIKNPNKVYFIGDSLEKDYNGAKDAGFTPILIREKNRLPELVKIFKNSQH